MSKSPTGRTDQFESDFLNSETAVDAQITYQPVPQDIGADDAGERPVWRIRLDLVSDVEQRIGLDINGEVILGRDLDAPNLVDLNEFGASKLGVSRQHAVLRPSASELTISDLGSTNGTMCNGVVIEKEVEHPVFSGDTLTLGRLQFVLHIVRPPDVHDTSFLGPKLNLEAALLRITRSITSQLNLDEVLNQIAEMAMSLTAAGETGIWLVDENTGELFLEAERGIEDERIRRMRLPIREDTLVGKVIKTGKPVRARRRPGQDQIKVKTNYLVEALVYVPIALGGETFGVLAAVHREVGKKFNSRDERLLAAIADSAAIAIQNARHYQATDEALALRVKELSALNEVSRTVSASLDLDRVYKVLVRQMNNHWPAEAVHLFLLSEDGQSLTDWQYESNGRPQKVYPFDQGIIGQVARTGQSLVTNDVESHPAFVAELDSVDGRIPHAIASVPLRVRDRVVGVLTLYNRKEDPFDEEDLDRLEAFANPIATAIENARLFAEANRQRAAIQATAQALPQPLIILDDNGNILISNQAAQEIIDSHLSQVFAAFSGGVGMTSEVAVGEKTYLSTAEHLPEVGTIFVMQDITYVKLLEQERSDFMHALSHDLKSPLTSITGWVQLLDRVTPLDERSKRYVRKILSATDRMLGMIEQLLYTVDEQGAVHLVQERCDLVGVIERVVNDVQGAALSKDIEIALDVEGQPYDILADAVRLYHMVLNLVDNAIKYSPKVGTVNVGIIFEDPVIMITVQDDGPGIPEGDLEHVFEKYYRGQGAVAKPGAGLGLSVVQAIAEGHGGGATVRNLPERGAEFTVTLPCSLRIVLDEVEEEEE